MRYRQFYLIRFIPPSLFIIWIQNSLCRLSLHFVNNASTDGTAAYLSKLTAMGKYHIINCTKNISGAGGFAKGLSQTITYDVDFLLMMMPCFRRIIWRNFFRREAAIRDIMLIGWKNRFRCFWLAGGRCSGTQVFMVWVFAGKLYGWIHSSPKCWWYRSNAPYWPHIWKVIVLSWWRYGRKRL